MEKVSAIKKRDLLDTLESWFTDSADWDKSWREESKTWYDYYNGVQWTSDEMETLNERGQAVSTYNHIAPAIDAIIGGERQNRPQVKMVGRTFDDSKIAQVKSSLYKYITDNTNSDDELDMMIRDAFVTGRGWMNVFVNMDGENFDDLFHAYVDYRDMFVDSYSKRDDMRDARYLHQAVYTDEDIVKRSFPKYKPDNTSDAGNGFESSSDDELFFDNGDRTRPRLINTWYKDEDGKVSTAVWVKGQLLYSSKNPYSINDFPYIQLTVKRDLENKPYGLVKPMISAQDEVNKRHSKALHYLNARQVLAEETAFVDWNEAKKTLAKPDGITKVQDSALSEGRVQIVDNTQLAATHIQMMEHAKNQVLALAGINASYMGQSGQYESAKKAQMAAGSAVNVLVPLMNKIRQSRHRLAKLTMGMVPDFYTDERLVRIIEPTGQYAFMPINQVAMLDDGTITRLNDLSSDDVDVTIEDAPAGLNDRIEQFNQLLGIQGQTGRPIPMEILLRYSSLKDKEQLAAELENHYNMQGQLQQAQQVIEQLQAQIQDMGGVINQKDSQIIQINTARQVDKSVSKAKEDIEKEKNAILNKVKS